MLARWLVAVLACILIAPASAQDGEVGPAIEIRLKFTDAGISLDGISRIQGPQYSQNGLAQAEPMFYEIVGSQEEVLYSGSIGDPRDRSSGSHDPETGKPVQGPSRAKEGLAILTVPEIEGAAKFIVYRRTSDDPDAGRTVALEAGL